MKGTDATRARGTCLYCAGLCCGQMLAWGRLVGGKRVERTAAGGCARWLAGPLRVVPRFCNLRARYRAGFETGRPADACGVTRLDGSSETIKCEALHMTLYK